MNRYSSAPASHISNHRVSLTGSLSIFSGAGTETLLLRLSGVGCRVSRVLGISDMFGYLQPSMAMLHLLLSVTATHNEIHAGHVLRRCPTVCGINTLMLLSLVSCWYIIEPRPPSATSSLLDQIKRARPNEPSIERIEGGTKVLTGRCFNLGICDNDEIGQTQSDMLRGRF